MEFSTLRTYPIMDPETQNIDSIAAKFVDFNGIRRGMERIPIFRTKTTNKAALGKSRRLMYSCIKQPLSFHQYKSYCLLTLTS